MQVGGGIWIIWDSYLVVKIVKLFIMKRHSQSSGYFWQLNKGKFSTDLVFAKTNLFTNYVKMPRRVLSPERSCFEKTGLRPFSISKHRLRFTEATKQEQTLIYSQITARGWTGRVKQISCLYGCDVTVSRCHDGARDHNRDTAERWRLPRIYAPESRSSSRRRVNVQIGIYISDLRRSGQLYPASYWLSSLDTPPWLVEYFKCTFQHFTMEIWSGPCHTVAVSAEPHGGGGVTLRSIQMIPVNFIYCFTQKSMAATVSNIPLFLPVFPARKKVIVKV